MSITITLPAELEQQILGRASESKQPVEEIAIGLIVQGLRRKKKDSFLDDEYMEACAQEADPNITLESVRQILAKIPSSIADDIIAERDERF
jgi:hypothetical protein